MDYDKAEAAIGKALANPPYDMDEAQRQEVGAAFAFLLVDAAKSLDAFFGAVDRIAKSMEAK